jgi:hypothetical protein
MNHRGAATHGRRRRDSSQRFLIDSTNESRNNTSNKCFLSPNMSTSWESGASG